MAISLATISGWCSPALSTNVPTWMRSVAAAAAARHCSGLQSLPTWSATRTVSNPSSSARLASAPTVAGSSARNCSPNLIGPR